MDNLPINGLDLAVGVVLLVSALLAFIRGFVHEVLSVIAWIGALAAAIYGLPYAAPYAHKIIQLGWAADAAASAIIFLVVLFLLSMGTHAVARAIQKTALNNVDRTLGFVFGLARAVVILGVSLIIADWLTDRDRPDWMRNAKTLPLIETAAEEMKALVPASFLGPATSVKNETHHINEAAEAKRTFDQLNQPANAAKAATPAEGGYKDSERLDMERLLNSAEKKSPGETEEKP
jgi:membrane protein required for colicin V production